ncbi:unnamed protein product [Calypogeia fissa]
MDDDDEDHHSDDSCLLHEFTSPTCSRAPSPPRCRTTACCSTSPCRPCRDPCPPCPILTSSRPPARLAKFDELNSRIDSLRRELRSSSIRTSVPSAAEIIDDDPLTCHCIRWDVSLIRALRRDPCSMPERRSDGRTSGTRIRQPGRADVGFTARKGDLIIHHEKKPGRKVMEFYDPICQRLHDGDILVRFKIDSYGCEGIVQVKGSAYVYQRGFWVYMGKDSDQINRSCNW